jgi:hypothetical protein
MFHAKVRDRHERSAPITEIGALRSLHKLKVINARA